MSQTILIPLPGSPKVLPTSVGVVASLTMAQHLANVVRAVRTASKVIIICGVLNAMAEMARVLMNPPGAGISTGAGIADFRSTTGLFRTLKQHHTGARLHGKDLFDVSALQSATTRVPFSKMIGELARQSQSALPTPFHQLL
jgi:NAD-dependent SIR2 family protein deacetylase